ALPGVRAKSAGMGGDQAGRLKTTIREALRGCDVLLTTGGVSAGDYDLVPEILGELGVRCVFHKLRIKPGKPLWFGLSKKGQQVFGLPGNPVSTLTTFHEFVLPALRALMGQSAEAARPQGMYLPLAEDIAKKTPLLEYARARLLPGSAGEYARVAPAAHGGSGDFYSLTQSDGVLVLPEKEHLFERGQVVEYHPWRWH
ncbi:MAG TPA: molybdopterin-binding protein, partial [Planctomycetota bacterium]|nr:molybdopterin-binding protein [Planctomycetota bacterium]